MSCGDETAGSVVRPRVRAGVGAVEDGVEEEPRAVEESGAVEEPGAAEEEAVLEDDEGEAGTRTTRKMLNPALPSPDEVLEHNKTHLPFRNWCRHCARGRGVEMAHRTVKQESGLPELHLDFAFFGEEGEPGNTITVLVARERTTRMTMSSAVPSKSTGTFIARRVVAFMREVGCEHGDVIVKSDQEPAMTALLSEVGRVRAAGGGGKFIVESSPVGSSASNGIVERAIRSVEQQTRVLKSCLEERWSCKIPARHPIMPWLIEYASVLLNRFEVGRDGRSAYERSKGKVSKFIGVEFGEAVHWKRKAVGGALGKLTCLWEDGVYLGVRSRSGEIIVADVKGIWKTRSVQRKPFEERWDRKSGDSV